MINNPFQQPIIVRGNKQNVPKNATICSTSPIIFETKKQYVNELIKNQEKARGIKFSNNEKERFMHSELKKMQPVVARYTTKTNPYMPPETVFFTDNKISQNRISEMARHEFQHQAWEPFDSGGSKNMKQYILWSKSPGGQWFMETDFDNLVDANKRANELRNLGETVRITTK